jgi:hypothetical protein
MILFLNLRCSGSLKSNYYLVCSEIKKIKKIKFLFLSQGLGLSEGFSCQEALIGLQMELRLRDAYVGAWALFYGLLVMVRWCWLLSSKGRAGQLFPPDRYLTLLKCKG